MKYTISMIGFLLLGTGAAYAQVSSHAPTVFKQSPAQTMVKPAPAADKPVARVNGATLTDADLVREEYAIFPYARQHGGGFDDGVVKEFGFAALGGAELDRQRATYLYRLAEQRQIRKRH